MKGETLGELVGGFLVYAVAIHQGWETSAARNLLLLTMVLFENFHVGNCRSESHSVLGMSPLRSPMLFFGTLAALLLHVASMYVPFFNDLLATQGVSPAAWLVAIAVAISIVPAIELHKWAWRRRESNAAT